MQIKEKHVHFAGTKTIPAIIEHLKVLPVTIVVNEELVPLFRAKLPTHNVIEYTINSMCDEKEKRILIMPWSADCNYHLLYENRLVWTFSVERDFAGIRSLCAEPCCVAHCKDGVILGLTHYGKE